MERSELEQMKMQELRHLASVTDNLDFSPSDTKESLITKLLINSVEAPLPPPPVETPLEGFTAAKPAPAPNTSIEEVKEALNPFILRGLKLYHNPVDHTWLMTIKLKPMMVRDTNSGEVRQMQYQRDDSGTLNQPLEAIRRCARVLMSNAPAPREVEQERGLLKDYEAVA